MTRSIPAMHTILRRDLTVCNKKSECWKCGTENPNEKLFCEAPKCGVVLPISQETNLFDTFGLPHTYEIDIAKLDSAYKALQKQLHPDKFATKSIDEKAKSTESSSAVNYAYEVS